MRIWFYYTPRTKRDKEDVEKVACSVAELKMRVGVRLWICLEEKDFQKRSLPLEDYFFWRNSGLSRDETDIRLSKKKFIWGIQNPKALYILYSL